MSRLNRLIRPGATFRARFNLVVGLLLGVGVLNRAENAWAAHERGVAIVELQQAIERASGLADQRLTRGDLPPALAAERERVRSAALRVSDADGFGFQVIRAILLATALVAIGLTVVLSRDFGRAVAALKTGAEQFGSGELAHRVALAECDELREVASCLNGMAANLRQTRDHLEVRNSELVTLAFRDPLTNLANRALFRQRLEAAFGDSARRPDELAILFIDLDNFKSINDTFGHEAGDRLLIDVAGRLLNATRGSDTVARLGGDEFAVLLNRVRSPHEATIVGERIIASMHGTYAHNGLEIVPSASVGVALGQRGDGAAELMRNADIAMYRAKSRGRGLLEMYTPGGLRLVSDSRAGAA